MKRNYGGAAVFLLALVFIFFLASYGSAALAQATKVLKLGSFNPRSGPAASWGINSDQANDLAADERNKKGGVTVQGQQYKIELIHEDDKARGEEGVKATNKLIYTDKVKFIVGPMMSTPFLAAAPIIEATKTVTFVGCMAPQVLKDRKYIFRVTVPWNHSAPAYFKFVAKTFPELKSSVHISSNDATGWAATQADNDACHAAGIRVLGSELYEYGAQDFTSMLARILPLKPDFLSFAGTPPNIVGLVIKQARELGYKGRFIHASVCSPSVVGPIAGWENIEGMLTGSMTVEGANIPATIKKVHSDWVAKFGQENEGGFYDGIVQYPLIDVLCQGVEKANSLDPDKVVAALENLGEMNTAFGKARWGGMKTYNNNHQLLLPVWITQVRNKKLVLLGLEDAWETPAPELKWR
jgi:branched-chain amino acid transport system substrate-binding protein